MTLLSFIQLVILWLKTTTVRGFEPTLVPIRNVWNGSNPKLLILKWTHREFRVRRVIIKQRRTAYWFLVFAPCSCRPRSSAFDKRFAFTTKKIFRLTCERSIIYKTQSKTVPSRNDSKRNEFIEMNSRFRPEKD